MSISYCGGLLKPNMPEYAWITQWAKWPNGGKTHKAKMVFECLWQPMTAMYVAVLWFTTVDPSFKQAITGLAAASAHHLNDPQDQPWLARVYRLRLGAKRRPSPKEAWEVFLGLGRNFHKTPAIYRWRSRFHKRSFTLDAHRLPVASWWSHCHLLLLKSRKWPTIMCGPLPIYWTHGHYQPSHFVAADLSMLVADFSPEITGIRSEMFSGYGYK
jgi:hypothetical protein